MRESRFQFLFLVLAALFHPIVERWLRPWGLSVDYPFLVVFWIAIRRGRSPGALYGFLLGLLRDLSNFAVLGGSALAYCLARHLVRDLREKADRDNLGMRPALLILAQPSAHAVILLPQSGRPPPPPLRGWRRSAPPGWAPRGRG